ncbi:transposase [Alkalitalea saponilacus]|uniref:Transposase IS200-like domain-containing protein n=1 Tax=Alkalitalea saponilacus TaxID=889453 RepID=A0A1T5D5D1_9BACT|nr:transposase [Alkalitalea saponilacus]ASB50581.1 transposase [Alkalitalea saponilacus]SKB66827.1 hypothetical protein SAMN03080601_00981 [Alkalitalea saponilacus]
MADKFQNKYRIESTRLQNWDYGWNAAYFITICTKSRVHYFGDIVNSKVNLSGIGIIAEQLWYEIVNHVKNVELDEFVVMPNHIHGILILNGKNKHDPKNENIDNIDVGDDVHRNYDIADCGDGLDNGRDDGNGLDNVETRHALSLQCPQCPQCPPTIQTFHPPQPPTIGQQRFQNQGKNTLSSIIGSYKSAVTRHVKRLGYDFSWQPRFYDHIIRDHDSFLRIRKYIVNNPAKWNEDTFNNYKNKH